MSGFVGGYGPSLQSKALYGVNFNNKKANEEEEESKGPVFKLLKAPNELD
jgi:hypothetical protein